MPSFIGIGFSTQRDPLEAARSCCLQTMVQIHQRTPHLIIIFSSVHFINKIVLEAIRDIFGKGINVVGMSGGGIITPKGMLKYGIAIMAIHSTEIKFTVSHSLNVDKSECRLTGENLGHDLLRKFSKLGSYEREAGIIFMDGLIERGSDIILGLKNILGRSFPIVGGSAADNMHFARTFQICNNQILSNSIVGMIVSGNAICGYGIRHGWQPLGRPLFVTQCDGNIIKKIDGRPAVSIYEEYFDKTFEEIKKSIISLSILYPLEIYLPHEEEYLLRNATRVEDDGSLVCQGDVSEGCQIRLMMGTKESALQSARQAASQAKNAMSGRRILGALVFNSVSRSQLLGSKTNEEINAIKNIVGIDTPFIGLYTFGEQAPLKSLEHRGESHFHNETIVVLTIGERHADAK